MIKGRFGKFLIVATLTVVLVLSFGLKQAKAEALLFPYYKSDSADSVWSFLSLVSTWGGVIQYSWNYDDLSTTAKECIHEDAVGSMTPFDLIQQTVTDPFLSGIDIATDYSDTSSHEYSLINPAEGFLIVNNVGAAEGDFYGQMAIVDVGEGLVVAYKGLNNPELVDVDGNGIVDGMDPDDFSHISTSHTSYIMSNYPADVVDTSWFVLVTGRGMFTSPWGGSLTLTNGFATNYVWDRNEDPRSGVQDDPITCFDTITRSDIMTAAQVLQTDNGGLWWTVIVPNGATGATGGLMVKLEHTIALGSDMTAFSSENAFFNDPY